MPPGIRRDDTVMLYAWCRHADDVIDGQALGSRPEAVNDPQARLDGLRADTLAALQGDGPVTPPFAALRAVARRQDFPQAWPHGPDRSAFGMDIEARDYRSLDDVLEYSDHVAGIVGVMMARVMGVRDDPVLDRACDLGLAFQLTNIARDVIDDARIGRCYLPGDWLDQAGARIDGPVPSPELPNDRDPAAAGCGGTLLRVGAGGAGGSAAALRLVHRRRAADLSRHRAAHPQGRAAGLSPADQHVQGGQDRPAGHRGLGCRAITPAGGGRVATGPLDPAASRLGARRRAEPVPAGPRFPEPGGACCAASRPAARGWPHSGGTRSAGLTRSQKAALRGRAAASRPVSSPSAAWSPTTSSRSS